LIFYYRSNSFNAGTSFSPPQAGAAVNFLEQCAPSSKFSFSPFPCKLHHSPTPGCWTYLLLYSRRQGLDRSTCLRLLMCLISNTSPTLTLGSARVFNFISPLHFSDTSLLSLIYYFLLLTSCLITTYQGHTHQ
jgi:hypothetical protein